MDNSEDVPLPAIITVPKERLRHPETLRTKSSSLSTSRRYYNHTGRVIRIGTAEGLITEIPPKPDAASHAFLIRDSFDFDKASAIAAADFYKSVSQDETEAEAAFRKLFQEEYSKTTNDWVTITFEYVVDVKIFDEYPNGFFIAEANLILTDNRDVVPVHPNTGAGRGMQTKATKYDASGFDIELIDNSGNFGSRFMRMHGKMIEVQPTISMDKPAGIHVTYRGKTAGSRDKPSADLLFIPTDRVDATKWIFKTYAEAANSPESDVELQIQIKELERDMKIRTMEAADRASEIAAIKAAADLAKLESEKKNLDLVDKLTETTRKYDEMKAHREHEYSQIEHNSKMRQLQTKDHYEERSTVRKDTSDAVKFVPAIILGAIGLIATAIKLAK